MLWIASENGNDPSQGQILRDYSKLPFTSFWILLCTGPLYAFSFYLWILVAPLTFVTLFVVSAIPRREARGFKRMLVISFLLIDSHMTLSLICLMFTLNILKRPKRVVLLWNWIVFFLNLVPSACSIAVYFSKVGDSSLIVTYCLEMYILSVLQLVLILIVMIGKSDNTILFWLLAQDDSKNSKDKSSALKMSSTELINEE
jgi:hypothetical protein